MLAKWQMAFHLPMAQRQRCGVWYLTFKYRVFPSVVQWLLEPKMIQPQSYTKNPASHINSHVDDGDGGEDHGMKHPYNR